MENLASLRLPPQRPRIGLGSGDLMQVPAGQALKEVEMSARDRIEGIARWLTRGGDRVDRVLARQAGAERLLASAEDELAGLRRDVAPVVGAEASGVAPKSGRRTA